MIPGKASRRPRVEIGERGLRGTTGWREGRGETSGRTAELEEGGGETRRGRRKRVWKRPFRPLRALFAGVKWRGTRTGQIYDRYRRATDKELHSRQQPLRVIIEIRIGRSVAARRRRKKRGPRRGLPRAGERSTENAVGLSLAGSCPVYEGARARVCTG